MALAACAEVQPSDIANTATAMWLIQHEANIDTFFDHARGRAATCGFPTDFLVDSWRPRTRCRLRRSQLYPVAGKAILHSKPSNHQLKCTLHLTARIIVSSTPVPKPLATAY